MYLDDLRSYLIARGVAGGATGWPCYVGFMPDDQDACVALFPTPGLPPDTLARESELLGFQSRVRGARFGFSACYEKWRAVYDALQDAQEGIVLASPDPLAGFVYVMALQQGPLQFNDSNGRPNMTTNWKVRKLR